MCNAVRKLACLHQMAAEELMLVAAATERNRLICLRSHAERQRNGTVTPATKFAFHSIR